MFSSKKKINILKCKQFLIFFHIGTAVAYRIDNINSVLLMLTLLTFKY